MLGGRGVIHVADDSPGDLGGSLEPVVQESTPALIARSLRRAISSGEFPPGTQLGEAALARQLGVSRGPLREAMQRLVTEGLVVRTPGVGFEVGQLTASDIRDVFLTLAFVSGELSARAVGALGEEEFAELRAIHHESLALVHRRAVHGLDEKNREFYSIINHASDSPKLRWAAALCIRYVPRSLYSDVPGWPDITVAGQEAMIDALEDGDADSARAITESIHHRAGEALAESYDIIRAGLESA